MYMIKISEDKIGTLAENIEKGLRYMGKAMQCIDELQNEGGYGERTSYGMRHGYGMREDDYPMYEEEMGMRGGYGERRGVRGTGRYSMYR